MALNVCNLQDSIHKTILHHTYIIYLCNKCAIILYLTYSTYLYILKHVLNSNLQTHTNTDLYVNYTVEKLSQKYIINFINKILLKTALKNKSNYVTNLTIHYYLKCEYE